MKSYIKVNMHIAETGIVFFPMEPENPVDTSVFDASLVRMEIVEKAWYEGAVSYAKAMKIKEGKHVAEVSTVHTDLQQKINKLLNYPHVYNRLDESYPDGSFLIPYRYVSKCEISHKDALETIKALKNTPDGQANNAEFQKKYSQAQAEFQMHISDMTPTDAAFAQKQNEEKLKLKIEKEKAEGKTEGFSSLKPEKDVLVKSMNSFKLLSLANFVNPHCSLSKDAVLDTYDIDIFSNPASDDKPIASWNEEFIEDCKDNTDFFRDAVENYAISLQQVHEVFKEQVELYKKKTKLMNTFKKWTKTSKIMSQFFTSEGINSPTLKQKIKEITGLSDQAQSIATFDVEKAHSVYDINEIQEIDISNLIDPFKDAKCIEDENYKADCSLKNPPPQAQGNTQGEIHD